MVTAPQQGPHASCPRPGHLKGNFLSRRFTATKTEGKAGSPSGERTRLRRGGAHRTLNSHATQNVSASVASHMAAGAPRPDARRQGPWRARGRMSALIQSPEASRRPALAQPGLSGLKMRLGGG